MLKDVVITERATVAALVSATTGRAAGGTIRLILSGTVDGPRAQTVHRSIIDALRRHRPARIDIDLLGCTRIDPVALLTLCLCRADAAQVSCRLVFLQASDPTRRMLATAGLVDRGGG
jgi:anti-anti-sigma regulatory factor